MNILCTGHKGFIGSHLMKLYPNAVGYDLKEGNDILQGLKLTRFLQENQIDVIVHLAALISASDSEDHQDDYIANNVIGTSTVFQCAIDAGVKKIVFASSAACLEPSSSIYAMTKYAGELLCQHASDQIDTVILRFFNVYGKGQSPAYAGVIDKFIEGTKKGFVTIYGDGTQTRDFVNVADIVSGIDSAIKRDVISGSVIELGTGQPISINWLAGYIAGAMNKVVSRFTEPSRKEVKHSRAKIDAAKAALDWEPTIDIRVGLKDLIDEA